jgi:hypothetical protein
VEVDVPVVALGPSRCDELDKVKDGMEDARS